MALHNCVLRWSRAGVFVQIFAAPAAESMAPETAMIDRAHRKAYRIASSLREKGLLPAASDGAKAA
jgi:transposase